MKHAFVSAKSQGSDPTIVGPNQWNDTHVVGITSTSVNLTLTTAHDCVLCTGGVGGITITLPTTIGNGGRCFVIKKIDSGAGNISITPANTETIDGDSSYILVNRWQYVKIVADGASGWVIVGNN